jgi:hypothetical protein
MIIIPFSMFAQELVDITPIFGYSSSLSFPLSSDTDSKAKVISSVNLGITAGVRYDEDQVIEFQYSRQSSTMKFDGARAPSPVFSSQAVLEQFLVDFTHEFVLDEPVAVRPYVVASLGMTRITAVGESSNGFTFGVGSGVKWFPLKWLGIRAQGQWLPTLVDPKIKTLICAGGCVASLGGKPANQAKISVGPIFSF